MFTGIVETTGAVAQIERHSAGIALWLQPQSPLEHVALGESIAVNGTCLTVAEIGSHQGAQRLRFDLLEATWNRTNLGRLTANDVANLERALAAGGRLSGHFVTGHVDAVAPIATWEARGADHLLEIEPPGELLKYCVEKGCIAIDGMSLTIADIDGPRLRFWIIPHTREVTNLGHRSPGDLVNVEVDMLAKYVEKLTSSP